MKQLLLLIGLVLSPGAIAEDKADPRILEDYYGVLARETLKTKGKGYVTNLGKPVTAEFRHRNGSLFYVVASDIPEHGCLTIVFSYNEDRMKFLNWKQRWHCKSSVDSIAEFVEYDGKEFSFEDEQ